MSTEDTEFKVTIALVACLAWSCAKPADLPKEHGEWRAEKPAAVQSGKRPEAVRAVINRDYLPTALDLIQGAESSIDVIQYMIKPSGTVNRVTDALVRAQERGVTVRLLLDDTVRETRTEARRLAGRGIDVQLDEDVRNRAPGDKTTHNKLFIVDGRRVLVGSTNLSYSAIARNNEANILIEDEFLGGRFQEYFNRLWKHPTVEPDMAASVTPTVEALFNRQYGPAVEHLFNSAERRILISLYSIRPYEGQSAVGRLLGALGKAQARGVDVRVILDRSEGEWADITNENNAEAEAYFLKRSIPFKYESPNVISHAKMILVDDRVVVGGTNWGYGPLSHYNDCNVIVREAAIVRRFADGFERLWRGEEYLEPPPSAGY